MQKGVYTKYITFTCPQKYVQNMVILFLQTLNKMFWYGIYKYMYMFNTHTQTLSSCISLNMYNLKCCENLLKQATRSQGTHICLDFPEKTIKPQ